MIIDHNFVLQKSIKSIKADKSDLKLLGKASQVLPSSALLQLKSINLPFNSKTSLQRFPHKSSTILPKTNLSTYKKAQKCNSIFTFLISLIVISISIYECDKLFDSSYKLSTEDNFLRISMIGLTVLQIGLITLYYKCTLKVKVAYRILSKHSALYQDKELLIRVLAEVFICLILLPPYINFSKTFPQISVVQILSTDDILLGFILIRSLHLYKLYYEFSSYNSIKSRFYCNLLHIEDEFSFTLRCFFKDLPHLSMILLFTLCTILLGLLLHIYEQSVKSSSFTYLWNAFWIIGYTESTIGYGDIVPKTHLGRFVCIFSALSGIFLYSYVVTVVKSISDLTNNELKLASILNHNKNIANKFKLVAVVLIQRWWVLYMKRRIRISTVADVSHFNSQLVLFTYKHHKEIQEMNPGLNEEIKKMMELKQIANLGMFLEPVLKSEEMALRLGNMHHNSTKRLLYYSRRTKKLLGIRSSYRIEIPKTNSRQSRATAELNPATMKKLQKDAVKKLINKRLAQASVTHTKSLSSDEEFYSNSSRVSSHK